MTDLPLPERSVASLPPVVGDATRSTGNERPAAARAQDVVLALGRRAVATPDPDVLISDASHLIAEIAGTELALIARSESNVRQRLVAAAAGTMTPAPDRSTGGTTLAELAARQAHPIVVPDLLSSDVYSDRYLAGNHIRGLLIVPLRLQNADFGALGACSHRRVDFEVDAIYVAETIAHLVATTLAHYRSESLLQQARRITETVHDTMDAIVLVVDSTGIVQTMNRACREITGFARDDFMNRPVWSVLAPPNEVAVYEDAIKQLRTRVQPVALEAGLLTKHSESRTIAWRLAVSPEAGNETFILTGIDITEQRRAEERAERARKALAHLRAKGVDGSGTGSECSESGRSGELASGRRLTETERREKPRRPFPYRQNIAYILGNTYPGSEDFFKVRCRDIAAGGFSFVCSQPPHSDSLVVALGSPQHLTYLTARVVHVTDVVEEGEKAHLIGCRYTGRAPA